MPEAALGFWFCTILAGSYLFSYTTGLGRTDATARATALPPLLTFVHPVIGVTGIAAWIVFLVDRQPYQAWVGVVLLLLGAAVGDVLALRTAKKDPSKVRPGPYGQPADRVRAEDQMPKSAILVHGGLAVVTIGLAIASAVTA